MPVAPNSSSVAGGSLAPTCDEDQARRADRHRGRLVQRHLGGAYATRREWGRDLVVALCCACPSKLSQQAAGEVHPARKDSRSARVSYLWLDSSLGGFLWSAVASGMLLQEGRSAAVVTCRSCCRRFQPPTGCPDQRPSQRAERLQQKQHECKMVCVQVFGGATRSPNGCCQSMHVCVPTKPRLTGRLRQQASIPVSVARVPTTSVELAEPAEVCDSTGSVILFAAHSGTLPGPIAGITAVATSTASMWHPCLNRLTCASNRHAGADCSRNTPGTQLGQNWVQLDGTQTVCCVYEACAEPVGFVSTGLLLGSPSCA